MAVTRALLTNILKTEIHPFVVHTALYDRHVENRLFMLTEVEKAFEDQYHHKLFIQCDIEDRTVLYEIESACVSLHCSYES